MKVKVGFITAWRRAVFFALILAVIIFGLASTLATSLIGPGAVANAVGVVFLLIGGVFFLIVLFDRNDRFSGEGEGKIENGVFSYKDKRREFSIPLSEITKVTFDRIKQTETGRKVLAYKLTVKAGKKIRVIESERAEGRAEHEVSLYALYTELLTQLKER